MLVKVSYIVKQLITIFRCLGKLSFRSEILQITIDKITNNEVSDRPSSCSLWTFEQKGYLRKPEVEKLQTNEFKNICMISCI